LECYCLFGRHRILAIVALSSICSAFGSQGGLKADKVMIVRVRKSIVVGVAVAISHSFAQAPPVPTPDPTDMRVRLLAPFSTKWNRKGDVVSASVLEPVKYQGAILEGDIREIRAGEASPNKRSLIQFQFHTLHSSGAAIPVLANLVAIANSKNQPDIDEDGSALESGGATGLAGFRSTVAGRLHRGANDTGPISANPSRLSSRAPHLSFATGSEMALRFKVKPQ
jgi:hypothetical protein